MAINLPQQFSLFEGRRLLRFFTSHDRSKIGFEFEQLSTTSQYRFMFDVEGTIDRVDNLEKILGRRVTSIKAISLYAPTGQERFAVFVENDPQSFAIFYFSPSVVYATVDVTYTVEDRRRAPYAAANEYIVQENSFNYGPTEFAVPPVATYYLLYNLNDNLITESGDNLVWRLS